MNGIAKQRIKDALLARARTQAEASRESIEGLDVSAKSSVEPGAVVGFGGARYVVGIVADAVDVDGVTYEGISPDSPVYAAIEGLALGDTFDFRDRKQTIDFLA